MSLVKIIGVKGPVVQARIYYRNKQFKTFVDGALDDLAASEDVTRLDELNYALARHLLPNNERAAQYVYDLYTKSSYGVFEALGDVFFANGTSGGGRAVYPGMRELVELFRNVSKGAEWPDRALRVAPAEFLLQTAESLERAAVEAPVDLKFDAMADARALSTAAGQISGAGDFLPAPDYCINIIHRNWGLIRGERCVYDFLSQVARVCPHPRVGGFAARIEFKEAVARTFERWDAGEDEPADDDGMAEVQLAGGCYARVPKDYVVLNPADAPFCEDVVVVAARGCGFPHFLWICPDAAELVRDVARRREVYRAVARARDGYEAVEADSEGRLVEDGVEAGVFRLPDAAECTSKPPCGAAIYRPGEDGPFLR